MKRIVTLLVFGLAFSTAAFAQPTINIVTPEGTPPCTGDPICVEVVVADYTDILSTQYFIEWDSTVLQFTGTQSYNLPGLTAANFTLDNAGRLLLDWEFDDCNDPNASGYTILADGTVIYEVCFEALGDYGASSQIIIPTTGDPDPPTPFIRRKAASVFASCTNIGIAESNVDTALIGTCLRPFTIDISDESGNEGDLVCIDFSVFGFDGLTSFQFPVVWDSTLAVYENIIVPQNLPNLTFPGSFGVPGLAAGVQEGSITVSWSAPPPANVTTIADSTLIFQLCLRLKDGSCESDFEVAIAEEQPGQEFFNPQASNEFGGGFENIPIGQFAGNVNVGDCNPTGVQLNANCGAPVNLNDTVCVQVLAGANFTDVTDLSYLMEWNPGILNYIGVQNINLLNLNYPSDFNEANTANGILGLTWDSNAQDRPEGTVLYEVCFEVVGLGGNSPFSFINNDEDIAQINNGPNVGINPTNCEVTVDQPAGVVIELTDGLEGRPGDTLCFDFPVTNFTDVESMSFSLAFEPNFMEYMLAGGIQNINLPGASPANFGLLGFANGQITFEWDAGPVTLADGTSLFTLCFIIPDDAAPGTCDQLAIVDDPLEIEVITSSSNGGDVGLTGIGGNYCIVSPEGFYLEGLSVTGDLKDTLCVPYVVSEFVDITDASFCLNWNPGTMELVEVVDNGLIPGLNIDILNSPVGTACFDFSAPGGLTLPDSANVFDLCFDLLGPADTCYAVQVSESPQPTVNTLNGVGTLLDIDAEVCINDKLFVTVLQDALVPESCPGAEDGSILVLVEGGVGPYIYSWQTSPPQFTPEARFLPGGDVVVTILDQTGLSVTDTFNIPTLGGDLFANAGADRLASCDEDFPCTLVNPMVSEGDNIVYNWTATQGGAVCSAPNNPILLGAGPGLFTIEVIDTTTGCFVTDTVELLEPFFPPSGIDTADPPVITCADQEVMLTAQNLSDTVSYSWEAPDGTITEDVTNIMASDSGFYYLYTEVTATGCTSIDSILVDIDTIPPIAVASPGTDTTFLGCNDVATLIGFAGDTLTDLTFQWFDISGAPAGAPGNPIATTNMEGQYVFEVIDNVTGCTNSDTTSVVANDEFPIVNILQDPPPAFNCTDDPVVITAEVTNFDPDAVTVLWTGPGIEAGTEETLTPTVTAAGDYEIIVESDANGCITTQMITVGFDTIAPAISIELPDTINCNNDQVMITSSVTPADGQYLYEWFSVVLNVPVDQEPAPTVDVGLAGEYELTVTDTISGCSSIETVTVMLDTLAPSFEVGFIPTLNCIQDTVAVSTSVELPAGTYTVDWVPTPMPQAIPTIVDDSVAIFTEPGEYLVTVTNDINGCTTVDSLVSVVDQVIDEPTLVLVSDEYDVNCLQSTVLLDATGTTEGDSTTSISYQWNIITGSSDGPFNGLTLEVDAGGMYEFVVTNNISECEVRDTVIVNEDFEEPTAVANLAVSLACSMNTGQLDGTGSSEGPEFIYIWEELDGAMVIDTFAMGPNELIVDIAQAGTFRLVVYNTINGCEAISDNATTVTADGDLPMIVFGTPTDPEIGTFDVTCASPDTVTVRYFISNDTLFNFEDLVFTWEGGDVVQDIPQFQGFVPIDQLEGLDELVLTLTVVDQATGCTGEMDYILSDSISFPTAEVAPVEDILGCDDQAVTLDGSSSTTIGDDLTYLWINENGDSLSSMPTYDTEMAGGYWLIVTDNSNSCVDTIDMLVEVAIDTTGPALVLDSIPSFECDSELILVSAAQTGAPEDFMVTWTTQTGGVSIIGVNDSIAANVTGPGEFRLDLVSLANGCDTSLIFTVPADTMAPMVMIDTPDMLACPGQTVSLNTTIDSGVDSVMWSGPGEVNPPTALSVSVDQAGTYTLTVIADNGCEGTAEIEVMLNPDGQPNAMLEAENGDTELGCGDEVVLLYTGTSLGDEFIYEYVTVGEGQLEVALDSLSADVLEAGDYQLIVTNELNGCSDTSEVLTITMIQLDTAIAVVDSAGCGSLAIITGNLPEGATGVWTSVTGASFQDETSGTTEVTNLLEGENVVLWTISYDGCPDYSTAELTVTTESTPIAVDDVLQLGEGQVANSLSVIANDVLDGVSGYNLTFDVDPLLGSILDNGDGEVTYTLLTSLLIPGTDEFAYTICNSNCPELCDQAFVTVDILRDTVGGFTAPTGITPNDDGMNEALVFDDLLAFPEKYPDSELVVFNRWGDVVFEAKPYNNDWNGVNQDGNPLPDGTYYYILRLNIGEGEIIRGDVTIIR